MPSPAERSKWATLRNGRRVHIRALRPGDPAALDGLVADDEAIVALALDEIVGFARFHRTSADNADVVVVVADDWQRVGLATELLGRLGARAAAMGIRHFEADAVDENDSMLEEFAQWSPSKKMSFDNGVVHIDMPIEVGAQP